MPIPFIEAALTAGRDYLEKSKLWPKIQPGFALLSLYVTAAVLGYEYVGWAYQFTPELPLYLRSYIFRAITVAFMGVALLLICFRVVDRLAGAEKPKETVEAENELQRRRRRLNLGLRMTAVAVVLLAVSLLIHALLPKQATYVRVRFLDDPANRDALVYAIYELNRHQPNWQFDVDFTPLNLNAMDPARMARCGGDLLCEVTSLLPADNQPTVVITTRDLKDYVFWKRLDHVALVTTFGAGEYGTLTEVEYLSYCLIVQSVALNVRSDPRNPTADGRSHGSLLESSPPRDAFKARVLSAHLDPEDERMLLNRFGVEYLKSVKELMTLQWLRSPEMSASLARHYPAATRPALPPAG